MVCSSIWAPPSSTAAPSLAVVGVAAAGSPVEEPPGHVDVVADLEGAGGANLELPLARHHLCVDARDPQPSLQQESSRSEPGSGANRIRFSPSHARGGSSGSVITARAILLNHSPTPAVLSKPVSTQKALDPTHERLHTYAAHGVVRCQAPAHLR
jgi:hypothetical protein